MKTKVIYLYLLISVMVVSCSDSIDNSIKDVCKQIISETSLNEWEHMNPYLRIIEENKTKDSIYYSITIEIYTDFKENIEYTKRYKIDDVYVLMLNKNAPKHKFLFTEKEEMYTFDGKGWQLDFPYYKLRINRLNYDYCLLVNFY